MTIFKKIKICLGIVLIIISFFFTVRFICAKFNYFRINLPYFLGKSLEEKYEIIDGDFYRFLSFCKKAIPADGEAIFYNSWNIYSKIYPDNTYFMFQYHKQKSKFYLYPIKIYVFSHGRKEIGTPWEINPEQENEILKRVSHIIAYYSDREFPGFKIGYKYDSNRYVLVKER